MARRRVHRLNHRRVSRVSLQLPHAAWLFGIVPHLFLNAERLRVIEAKPLSLGPILFNEIIRRHQRSVDAVERQVG
jgi:hypothetical protein